MLFPPRPNPGAELSPKNHQTLALYYEIKAGAAIPDDSIVRRNCALLKLVEDAFERSQIDRLSVEPLVTAMTQTAQWSRRRR